ncbi:hypothetical protein AGMMS49545_20050 [Betaproteobacteria bacterium]|nr:hypothetical protein AGMMS49545_20050 [Betaproteobacteria bacterium]GHU47771.1 hypothetical protein AGMMS50289_23450 [Betaproteobacteria bacterium]
MEAIVVGIGVVALAWFILPIVALARQSALNQRCAFLQRQLKELTERFESVSRRLERLETAKVVARPASVATAAARVDMETPPPKSVTLTVEPPPTVTSAAAANAPEPQIELDDLAEVVKSMYRTAAETSTAAPVETPQPAQTSPTQTPTTPAASPASSPLDALLTPASPSTPQRAKTAVPPAALRVSPQKPAEPALLERAFAWLSGGNAVLRMGVVLLFIGLAFLLRFASEQIHLPVQARYIGVALTALALLFLGWRLRDKRPSYGLILQGTGIAVLYLTVFAAYQLHGLLPSDAARVLLVLVTICSVILAVKQDALSLACAAALGGFAVPILISSHSGEHVKLFSYFALLSTGIAFVAWFKAWRVLNLIGFVSTFGIGIAWGLRAYRPELFASTEPFLLLFFLLYVAIGLLFTRRQLLSEQDEPDDDERHALLSWSVRRTDYLDGSLVFGPPLIGFGLQCAVIGHIEFGMAFSALALGLFYLSLAFILRGRETWRRLTLLRESCLALGVVFGTLAIPLALDAQWTSAAWAVEGAGLYWLGLRQSRRLAQGFSVFLMTAASLTYLNGIERGVVGGDALLNAAHAGSLGAALLGAALLFAHLVLRHDLQRNEAAAGSVKAALLPTFAFSGLAFLYLLPPLSLGASMTVICWALMGLATLFAGLLLKSRSFLISGFAVQLLGGVLFLLDLEMGTGGSVLASGWQGLLIAFQVGVALIVSTLFVRQETRPRDHPLLASGTSVVTLTGLIFLNLTVLFKLNWVEASAVWAVSGLLILWIGLLLQRRPVFYFGVLLEAVGGMAFLMNSAAWSAYPLETGLTPLMHFDFWTPAALTLAALAGAWRVRSIAARVPEKSRLRAKDDPIDTGQLGLLSALLLLWGIGWWMWTGFSELARFIFPPDLAYAALLALSVSALVWLWLARRVAWRALALLTTLLPPVAAVMVLVYYCRLPYGVGAYMLNMLYEFYAEVLFTPFGILTWLVFFAIHFFALKRLADLLFEPVAHNLHIMGCWLLLAVLMLAAHDGMLLLSVEVNAWRWLGWAVAPSLYLFWMSRARPNIYPLTDFPRAYRTHAALPVALGLLAWAFFANLRSDGDAYPLPYLPLVNPLEIGLLLTLLTVYRWSQGAFARYASTESPFCPAPVAQGLFGISLLAVLTLTVCRSAHHWAGIPFDAAHLLDSMGVQAGLSLVWTLYALILMIGGHRRANRGVWMAGAALVGVVVVKLFFVELGESGSLARIVSFIGVGVLLLIVGYFSPLPPRREHQE